MPVSYAYHPDMPDDCPLPDKEPVSLIFRAVDHFPPNAEDFVSDVEAKRAWALKKQPCKYWGCSVWKSEEGVKHGREAYLHFRESWIVSGQLDAADGEVCDTPSKKQPLHSTFWKVHELDISGKFVLAHPPVPADPDDPLNPAGS